VISDFYTVEQGHPVHYVRSGECNRCGACCGARSTIRYTVEVQVGSDEDAESGDSWQAADWSAWGGYTLFWAQGLWWYVKVLSVEDDPNPCRAQDTQTGLCTLWNTDEFPAICRYWPFRSSDLDSFPQCGFSFERGKS
jgi:Fe-S-cluster containining protein